MVQAIWCLKKFKETQEINGNDESYVDKWMGFDGSFEITLIITCCVLEPWGDHSRFN